MLLFAGEMQNINREIFPVKKQVVYFIQNDKID